MSHTVILYDMDNRGRIAALCHVTKRLPSQLADFVDRYGTILLWLAITPPFAGRCQQMSVFHSFIAK